MSGNIDVTVENQLVRFVAPEPIDGDAVIEHLDGQRVGKMVIKALRRPRATLVIDPEGRVTVHGTHRCLLYTSPSPRDGLLSRMPSSA